jgi:hypothetical protein
VPGAGAAARLRFSEEHAVGLVPELGEGDLRRRGRNKPETVSGTLLRRCRDLNGRRGLEEVAGELIDWVAESEDTPGHAAPLEIKGFNDRPNDVSERASGGKAIGNREGVEYADVSNVKLRRAFIEISPGAPLWDGRYPGSQGRGNSGVVGMQAQRACCREAVESYERECAPMRYSIVAAELAGHEPHVRVEIVRSTVASVQICSGASQKQVGLRDDATEVKDL